MKRSGSLKRHRKKARSIFIPPPGEGSAYWKAAVCAGGCRMKGRSGPCDGPIDAHHIVSKQELRRRGFESHFYTPEIGLALCRRHHMLHENATLRVDLALIPHSSVLLVEKLLGDYGHDYLRRYYNHTEAA